MKLNFKNSALLFCVIIIYTKISAQNANTTLSNLTSPTKVNVNLAPSKDSSINLGNNTKSWKNIYIKGKIYISDTPTIFSINSNDFFAGPNAGIKLKYFSGQRNTGVGANALYYGGYSNTGVGWNSLATDSTGSYNAAVGALSLLNNESGNENTAVGNAAVYKNITGSYNTGIGSSALQANLSGDYNVAVGAYSLYECYNSQKNTAVGYNSLYSSTNGFNNTALGYSSLYNCTGGFQNTSVGYNAGLNVTSGDDNTFIGTNANCGSTGILENATALGYAATVTTSNHIRIGNTSITSIGGQVGWSTLSDARIKNNIQQNVPGLAFINLLKPITYHFDLNKQENIFGRKITENWTGKYDIEKVQFTGFIAQDVEAAAKKIGYDFSGVDVPRNDKDLYSLRYSDFVVPLVKAVQELSKQNDSLKNDNEEMKSELGNLKSEMENIKAMITSNKLSAINQQAASSFSTGGGWEEAFPNPFSNSTTINYSLPAKFISAKIIITDKNGNALKTIKLSNNKGSVNMDAATLSSGAYQYSLYVDGRLIDTKQMEHIK